MPDFAMQDLWSELTLGLVPRLREQRHPFLKGMLAFHVLLSLGYAITGFARARGRVVLEGHDVSYLAPEARSRAGLGRSFQDARLFPSLTVFETLAMAFERHVRAEGVVSTAIGAPWVRRSERRVSERVEELISLMGLGAFRDKFVSEISTGSRRIVDLAVILAHDPSVLLLDEPSSGIAQRETEALGPMLLKIREQTGATMLVIEHDMPLIRAISDEIVALDTGSVLTRGKPDEVLEDPRLVSAYLGTDHQIVDRSGAARSRRRRRWRPRRVASVRCRRSESPRRRSTPRTLVWWTIVRSACSTAGSAVSRWPGPSSTSFPTRTSSTSVTRAAIRMGRGRSTRCGRSRARSRACWSSGTT